MNRLSLLTLSFLLIQQFLHGQNDIREFSLTDMDEKPISLSKFNNKKAVVIIFTSYNCIYRKKYETRVQNLVKWASFKNIQFLMINSTDSHQDPEEKKVVLKKYNLEKLYGCPYLVDSNQVIAKKFGATQV